MNNQRLEKKTVFGRNMCALFITIISRLKILTFLNEKKSGKKNKERKESSALKNETDVPSQSTDGNL